MLRDMSPLSFLISAFLHLTVIILAWTGLPFPQDTPQAAAPVVMEVELVSLVKAETAPPKMETPPPPIPSSRPTPQPRAVPEPDVEAIPIPEKKPKKALKKVEKKQSEKQMPHPVKPPLNRIREKPKKEPPKNDFASVLRTVETLKKNVQVQQRNEEKDKPEEKQPSEKALTLAQTLAALSREKDSPPLNQPSLSDPAARLSDDEMAAVKRQIAGCWNIQSGAMNAENLVVRLRVMMNPDMTVRRVTIISGKESRLPFWQQAVESAERAVWQCSPLKLPLGKYDTWRIINFTFDPKEMFG